MLTPTAPPSTVVGRLLLAVVASGVAVALVHAPDAAASSGASAPPAPGSVAPVSVSLSAPPSVPQGQAALLGVAVTAADTRLAVAGGTVVLDRRDAGTRRWREAARSVTGPHGHVAFSVRVRSSQDFRARALANDFFAPGRSGVLRVQVTR